ncbi:MAG: SprT family zinc-dependent metalloprotease [Rickettsiales bacterium]
MQEPLFPQTIKGFTIVVQRNRKATRLRLKVDPMRDRIVLTIPHRCTLTRAEEFLKEKKSWLTQEIDMLPPRIPLTYDTTLPILGKDTKLIPSTRRSRVKNVLSILATPTRCEDTVKRILKHRLLAYIKPRAERYAAMVGKDIHRIRLVETSTRFASCSPNGVIAFSWRLVFAPRPVIDYVIAHEVAHLRELHHGPKFWDLVEEICPNYERHRLWLKREGLQLFRYGSVKERG